MRLSNTAIEQFIRCPHQYHKERHEGRKGEPSQSMLMGRVVHRTIDRLLRQHKKEGRTDYLHIGDATGIYTRLWSAETGLHDHDKFALGFQQVHDLINQLGPIDPQIIYSIEHGFSLQFEGGLEIAGVIDLIICREVIDDETGEVLLHVEVVDWKTSMGFMAPSEAHDSLQLSIYIMAAKQLFPGATKVSGALYMLKDGLHLPTARTDQDLAEDYLFVRSMAQRIETEEDWAPVLNSSCPYCHLRRECPAYRDALTGPLPMAAEDQEDLEALAAEREELDRREKAVKKRKDEISDILKAHLRTFNNSLELGNCIYKLSQVPRKSYPALETVHLIASRLNMRDKDVIQKICTVNNKKLKDLIKSDGSAKARMAGAALENIVETSYSSRLFSKKIKQNKKKAGGNR